MQAAQSVSEFMALPACLLEAMAKEERLDNENHWPELSEAYKVAETNSRSYAQRLAHHDAHGTGLNFGLPVFAGADSIQAFEALANTFTNTSGTDPIADLQLNTFNDHVGGWLMTKINTLDDLLSAVELLGSMDESVRPSCAGRLVARLELDPLIVDPTASPHRKILDFLNFHNTMDFGEGCDEFAAGFLFTKRIYTRAALVGEATWGLAHDLRHSEVL